MTMRGSCKCKNIEVNWHTVDYSLLPRACQCQYCKEKDAAYVSKSGSRFDVNVHREVLHKLVQNGAGNALFHECGGCGDVVFVTVDIGGEIFGALNANCMKNKLGFAAAVEVDFSSQPVTEKVERWSRNWCHPVAMNVKASS